ncbi:MAG: GNAT family N-acetyltransferase [Streptosporangiaceae bacterium]
MTWFTTGSVGEFLAQSGDFLRAEPARNTVILSVTENLLLSAAARSPEAPAPDEPLLGWWRPGPAGNPGAVGGAFLHTPGFPVFLTLMTGEAVTGLAGELAGSGRRVPGLNAEAQAAQAFADAWRQRTGDVSTVYRLIRLYRLETLVRPNPGPQGTPRVADERDRGLLTEWSRAFLREIGDAAEDPAAEVDGRLGYGGLTVWEVGGRPVSMAGITRIVHAMARAGSVYTPPELRGRGYAGGATAAVSQAALDAGAAEIVLLYTDLANRTSNALYERLGYRPVEDRTVLSFAPAAGSP